MKRFSELVTTLLPFVAIISFFPFEAQAYIDPGTGSYVIQMIIAAAVGGAFAVKMFWLNIKVAFYNIFHKKKKEEVVIEDGLKKDE